MFYLHGKIVEDQGIHAVSPVYGGYEYLAILDRLQANNFVVISRLRPKNADPETSARMIQQQVNQLVEAKVPPENITIVGASKGAGIAVSTSYLLKDSKINYVLLGFCAPDTVKELRQRKISLYGNFLTIYDSIDTEAGSCQELFDISDGKGIGRHNEIVLHIGTGHGILFKPLDEWLIPTVEWARGGGEL